MAGYCRAAVGLLPVVMNTVPGPCDGIVWASDRTTLILSATPAIFGRCSENWTPWALVSIDLNSPRMPSGASGLLSHMSMVAGPPASHTRMTLWAFALLSFLLADFAARKLGRLRPMSPALPTCRKSRRWNPSQSVLNVDIGRSPG